MHIPYPDSRFEPITLGINDGDKEAAFDKYYDPTYHNIPEFRTDPEIDYWTNPSGGDPLFPMPHDWKLLGMPPSFYSGGENGAFADAEVNEGDIVPFCPLIRKGFIDNYLRAGQYTAPTHPPLNHWAEGFFGLNPTTKMAAGWYPSLLIAGGTPISHWMGPGDTGGVDRASKIPLNCGNLMRMPGDDTCCPFRGHDCFDINGLCHLNPDNRSFSPVNCFKLWRKGSCEQPNPFYACDEYADAPCPYVETQTSTTFLPGMQAGCDQTYKSHGLVGDPNSALSHAWTHPCLSSRYAVDQLAEGSCARAACQGGDCCQSSCCECREETFGCFDCNDGWLTAQTYQHCRCTGDGDEGEGGECSGLCGWGADGQAEDPPKGAND